MTLFTSLGIVLVFALTSFSETFWLDDYSTWLFGQYEQMIGNGRPVLEVLVDVPFSWLVGPEQGNILKVLGLLGLIATQVIVAAVFKGSASTNLVVAASGLALTAPTFMFYAGWAVAWPYSWAMGLSVIAWMMWDSRKTGIRLVGLLVLSTSLLMYPPAAVFFFGVIAVQIASEPLEVPLALKKLLRGVFLVVSSVLLAVPIALITMAMAGVERVSRSSLLGPEEVPMKLVWLLTRPLVVALIPFSVENPGDVILALWALPVGILLFLLLIQQARKINQAVVPWITLVCLALVLTLLPITVISENLIMHRTIPGLTWAVGVLFIVLGAQSVRHLVLSRVGFESTWRFLGSFCLIALFVLATILTNVRFSELVLNPYRQKNEFLDSKLADCRNAGEFNRITVHPATGPWPARPRIGDFSIVSDMAYSWVPEGSVRARLPDEIRQNFPVRVLESIESRQPAGLSNCNIHLEEFRDFLTTTM